MKVLCFGCKNTHCHFNDANFLQDVGYMQHKLHLPKPFFLHDMIKKIDFVVNFVKDLFFSLHGIKLKRGETKRKLEYFFSSLLKTLCKLFWQFCFPRVNTHNFA